MTPNKTVDAQKALEALDRIPYTALNPTDRKTIRAALQTAAASKPNPVEEVDWLKRGATVHVNGEPCEVLRISEDSGVLLSRFGWKCRTLIDEHKAAASEVGECEQCHGTGEIFTHRYDCYDDLCALNGDAHSCTGVVVPCDCALSRKPVDVAAENYCSGCQAELYGLTPSRTKKPAEVNEKMLDALRAAYWFINASDQELSETGISRKKFLADFHRLCPSLEAITAAEQSAQEKGERCQRKL
jgi:hypothetical protein